MEQIYVYVAGPLHSSGRATDNIRVAIEVGEAIRAMGAIPFVPHLFAFWDMQSQHAAPYWLSMDKAWLQRCHALFRIPGKSYGSDQEWLWAEEEGMQRFQYSDLTEGLEALDRWIKKAKRGEVALKKFETQRDNKDFSLDTLQDMIKPWVDKNFPHTYPEGVLPYRPFLGMVEELGEMARAHLKAEQGIRGSSEEHEEKGKDGLADLFIYACDYANRRNWRIKDIVQYTWEKVVSKRDWTKNKLDGTVPELPPGTELADPSAFKYEIGQTVVHPKHRFTGKIEHRYLDAAKGPMYRYLGGVSHYPEDELVEPVARPDYKYREGQEVRSLSGRGGVGIGEIVDRRTVTGQECPEYLCRFGAFKAWLPEYDVDPVVIGLDIATENDKTVLVGVVNGERFSLIEGEEYLLAPNPYRHGMKVTLTKINSPNSVRVLNPLEDEGVQRSYLVEPLELRPVPEGYDDEQAEGVGTHVDR